MATRAANPAPRSAIVAALLSFVIPGLGQGWLGATRRGLVMAVPVLLLLGFGLGTLMFEGRVRTLGLLLQPGVLLLLLMLDLVLLVWRTGAIVDAFRLARRLSPHSPSPRNRLLGGSLLGALLVATVGMHAAFGYVGMKTYDTITTVFATPEPSPSPTPDPNATGPATPTPLPTPAPTPAPIWSADGRLDLLLVGADAGPGRFSLRTDTMILLSVDVATGRAAMFGIPRNMQNVPLPEGPAAAFPFCDCFPDLINGLFVYAGQHPELFRGGDARGYLALQDAVGELVDRELDGMVVVTLQGFVRLVDALGGLDIYTPYSLFDASYPHEDGNRHEQVWIPAGQHHLDGHLALAFARSRHQDNDYNRMWRQQLVLTAFRQQMCPDDLVLRTPELLDIARDSLWTNVPIEDLPDLLQLANRVKTDRIARNQFWPPAIAERLTPDGIALIRSLVADAFAPPAPGSPRSPGATRAPTPAPIDDGC